jgi:hypothetical protein
MALNETEATDVGLPSAIIDSGVATHPRHPSTGVNTSQPQATSTEHPPSLEADGQEQCARCGIAPAPSRCSRCRVVD